MYSIGAKIIKPHNEKPDELENTISQVCVYLNRFSLCLSVLTFFYKVDNEIIVCDLHKNYFKIIVLFRR